MSIEDTGGQDLGRDQTSDPVQKSGASVYSGKDGPVPTRLSGDPDIAGPAGTPDSDPLGSAAEAATDDPMSVGAGTAGGGMPGGGDRASDRQVSDPGEAAIASGVQDAEEDRESQRSAAEFAAEHDPADHDIAAGEEFRQPGDWTADEAGGPQVWDADGNLVAEGDATS